MEDDDVDDDAEPFVPAAPFVVLLVPPFVVLLVPFLLDPFVFPAVPVVPTPLPALAPAPPSAPEGAGADPTAAVAAATA